PEWEWEDQDGDGQADPTYGKRDIALLAAAGGGNTSGAVYVIDITDPRAPVVISKWQNPTGAGHTPISYLHEAQFLHGDPNTIFVADEILGNNCSAGRLYVVHISDDLVHTAKRSEWTVGAGMHDLPVCMGSHVFSSQDRHVFMGAYHAGLQVIDLRDPAQPKRAGRYIAEGQNAWGALYHRGVVYVGDFGGRGLDVYEFIKDPVARGFLKVGNPTSRLATPGGGVTELTGACKADAPTNDLDGMLVQIPTSKRDGTATIKAFGTGAPGAYDVDIWFYNANCAYLGGIREEGQEIGGDASGLILEGAAFAYVDLWAGTPQWVYAQLP
ncbi:MAG TPA: hypothetical protein VM638_07305, partial [Actinomycetota bacterium]|nr:hypothetical protein [Actinomycetota bacterium]